MVLQCLKDTISFQLPNSDSDKWYGFITTTDEGQGITNENGSRLVGLASYIPIGGRVSLSFP